MKRTLAALALVGFCTAAKCAPIVEAPVKIEAPVKVDADVSAQLLNLQAQIDKLSVQVGDRIGGNVYNIGTSAVITFAGLATYIIAHRPKTTRKILDALKGNGK